MKKGICFLILILSMICTRNFYAQANEESIISNIQIQNNENLSKDMYALKAENMGTKSVLDIAKILETTGWWPENQNYFICADDSETMAISFQTKIDDRDYVEKQMMLSGTLFLALFDDLTEIDFSYILEKNQVEIEYGIRWDLETTQEFLNCEDIKVYGVTEENFETLIKILWDNYCEDF